MDRDDRFKIIFEKSADGILIADAETRKFIYANEALCGMLGYGRGEILNLSINDIHPEESLEEVHRQFDLQRSGEKPLAENVPCLKKNGEVVYMDINSVQMELSGRECVVGFFRDYSERREAEEKLKKSEQKFRDLFENANDLIQSVTPEGKFAYVNRMWLKTMGYEKSELEELTLFDILREDQVPHCQEMFKRVMNGESLDHVEAVFKARDGREIYVEGSVNGEFRDGHFVSTRAFFRNVTERKYWERELKKSEEKYRTLVEDVPLVLFSIDENGIVTAANRAMKTQFNVDPEEIIGVNYFGFFEGENIARARKELELAKKGESISGEIEVVSPKNEKFIMDYTIKPVIIEREYKGFIGFARNVTREKKAEQERRRLEEQLRHSQRLESVGQLAAGVAHDFNNILTGIMGYAELVQDELDAESGPYADMNQLNTLAERASNLVSQLLVFSRQQDSNMIPVNVNDLVESTFQMLERLIPETIKLEFNPGGHMGEIQADPGQIQQVITNLVVNARDAISGSGRITIETSNVHLDEEYSKSHFEIEAGHYVMLAVTDTGCGMDKLTREHVFEPFFTTKDVGKGTGLGLSTVYGIVKQHKGSVWLYSEPGRGTVFKIYIPRSDKPRETGNIILLVEDEDMVRNIVERTLIKQGFQVLSAADPAEAEKVFAEHVKEICLLLTDVVMPGYDGPELYRRLKTRKEALKVIYMSGYTDIGAPRASVMDKDAAFLQKPFTSNALLEKVSELVEPPSGD